MLLVGRVGRAHGLRGDVLVQLLTTEEQRTAPGSVLTAPDGRQLVVSTSRPHQDRWIVRFEGVDDRTAAESLNGTELRADAIDDPEALWVHELVGADVVDCAGVARGNVVSVLANPAADLLELDGGALVPMTFVVGWDDDRRLVVDPPDGLFEL